MEKVVELVGGGSVINGAYPVQYVTCLPWANNKDYTCTCVGISPWITLPCLASPANPSPHSRHPSLHLAVRKPEQQQRRSSRAGPTKGSSCTAPLGAAGKKEKNTATLFFWCFEGAGVGLEGRAGSRSWRRGRSAGGGRRLLALAASLLLFVASCPTDPTTVAGASLPSLCTALPSLVMAGPLQTFLASPMWPWSHGKLYQ